jgi:alkylation response protein AidB-like acyl-CoA dehydrogenase
LPDSLQLGLRAAPLSIVSFEETNVSHDDVLAKGESARVALTHGLERELLLLTARSVGTARAAFDYAAQYATERNTFGRAIADHQAIAFMVADMGIRVDAASALLWNAAWAVGADHASRPSAVISAGRFAADHVGSLTSDAVQILGGHGYIQDHPVEKWMRDARTLANYAASVMNDLAGLRVSA